MWWLLFVITFAVLLVAAMVYVEFRPAGKQGRFDRRTDSKTNQMALQAQSNSTRNQSSMLW